MESWVEGQCDGVRGCGIEVWLGFLLSRLATRYAPREKLGARGVEASELCF